MWRGALLVLPVRRLVLSVRLALLGLPERLALRVSKGCRDRLVLRAHRARLVRLVPLRWCRVLLALRARPAQRVPPERQVAQGQRARRRLSLVRLALKEQRVPLG